MSAVPRAVTTAAVTAQNTGTGWLQPDGPFNVSVGAGTGWVATVYLQRSFDGGTTAETVKTYTTAAQEIVPVSPETGVLYRLFVPTGSFTSAVSDIPLRLSN